MWQQQGVQLQVPQQSQQHRQAHSTEKTTCPAPESTAAEPPGSSQLFQTTMIMSAHVSMVLSWAAAAPHLLGGLLAS